MAWPKWCKKMAQWLKTDISNDGWVSLFYYLPEVWHKIFLRNNRQLFAILFFYYYPETGPFLFVNWVCFGSFVAEKKVNHNFVEVLAHASFVTVSNSISLEIWKQYSKYLIILEAFINSSFIRIRISSFIHRINKFTAPYKNIKWSYLEN